jgi:hypothetical protein
VKPAVCTTIDSYPQRSWKKEEKKKTKIQKY